MEDSNYWLEKIDTNSLVILDSPYDSINKSSCSYGPIFNKQHHERLYLFLELLNKKGVKLIIFNHDTPFIRDLYKNYNYLTIKKYCNMSRKYKTEIMLYN